MTEQNLKRKAELLLKQAADGIAAVEIFASEEGKDYRCILLGRSLDEEASFDDFLCCRLAYDRLCATVEYGSAGLSFSIDSVTKWLELGSNKLTSEMRKIANMPRESQKRTLLLDFFRSRIINSFWMLERAKSGLVTARTKAPANVINALFPLNDLSTQMPIPDYATLHNRWKIAMESMRTRRNSQLCINETDAEAWKVATNRVELKNSKDMDLLSSDSRTTPSATWAENSQQSSDNEQAEIPEFAEPKMVAETSDEENDSETDDEDGEMATEQDTLARHVSILQNPIVRDGKSSFRLDSTNRREAGALKAPIMGTEFSIPVTQELCKIFENNEYADHVLGVLKGRTIDQYLETEPQCGNIFPDFWEVYPHIKEETEKRYSNGEKQTSSSFSHATWKDRVHEDNNRIETPAASAFAFHDLISPRARNILRRFCFFECAFESYAGNSGSGRFVRLLC